MIPALRPLCLALLLLFPPALRAGEVRLWKSAEGDRTLEGEFVSLEGDRITLKLKDGKTSTFAFDKLSEEDRAFARDESARAKSDLRVILGESRQAFDTVRFGMTREAYDKALAASKHTLNVGGSEVEFFGQTVQIGDFVALIADRHYKFRPLFEDDALTELRLESTPVDFSSPGAIRSRVGEIKALAVLAFGDPETSYDFPDPKKLEPNAFGITDIWSLPGGRKLYLAISRTDSKNQLACTLRVTGKG